MLTFSQVRVTHFLRRPGGRVSASGLAMAFVAASRVSETSPQETLTGGDAVVDSGSLAGTGKVLADVRYQSVPAARPAPTNVSSWPKAALIRTPHSGHSNQSRALRPAIEAPRMVASLDGCSRRTQRLVLRPVADSLIRRKPTLQCRKQALEVGGHRRPKSVRCNDGFVFTSRLT